MSQYFTFVNLDKKEVLNPRALGTGLKLYEICANRGAQVLAWLVAKGPQDEVGGQVLEVPSLQPKEGSVFHTCGRWAGDRVVLIGDYDRSRIFKKAEAYKDISAETIEEFNRFVGSDFAVGRGEPRDE